MDELTFRRRIYANPDDNEQDVLDACLQDPVKAKFKADMQQFDDSLTKALNIDVPDNLADRVLLSQTIDFQQAQKRKSRVHLALAASVAFTSGLTFQMFGISPRHDSLGEHALAHVHAEIGHMHDEASYTTDQLNVKLASFGAQMTSDVAPIKFANYCYFGGVKSLHVVLEGDTHPVTIFFVPNNAGMKNTEVFSDNDFQGESVQFQKADMLIVTDKNDSVDKWRNKITDAIEWEKA